MNDIIRVSQHQTGKVRSSVRNQCCNCMSGNCLLLDGLESCPCPQLISRSLNCRWYLNAVLPGDRHLYDELILQKGRKLCTECGQAFVPGSNRAKYCPACSARVRRRKEAERQRKRYHARE